MWGASILNLVPGGVDRSPHFLPDDGQHLFCPTLNTSIRAVLEELPSNVLIVEPYHGLGNRLRALASASALSSKTGRKLVVVWIPDVHVNARLSDLYQVSSVVVFDSPIISLLRACHPKVLEYDYLGRGRKDEKLRDHMSNPIYVRSAYILQSQTRVTEEDIAVHLRKMKPVPPIVDKISRMERYVAGLRGNTFRTVGVHIRMLSNLKVDVPGIENLTSHHSAGMKAMGPVEKHRSRCDYRAFIPHLEREVQKDPDVIFLIASDTPRAVSALREQIGDRVVSIKDALDEASCDGSHRRGVTCSQIALAEFTVLSKASSLILSDWSSASELIRRLSTTKPQHESGCLPRKHSLPSPVQSILNLFHRWPFT